MESIEWGLDRLSNFGRFFIDNRVFSKTAVLKTAYWYTDLYYIQIRNLPEDCFEVIIRCKGSFDSVKLEKMSSEFCNKLIDAQIRQEIISETQEIQELIIRKAFGEGAKKNIPSQLNLSHEDEIPNMGDSFQKDERHIRSTL